MCFFIALEIPSQNLAQFQAIQTNLSILIPQARLTHLDKIHLTLVFLGEQADSLKNSLIGVIKKAVLDIPPFEVTPAYIDGFPNIHHPKVLWVGVKGDIDRLLIIHERIKDERRFVPHISIAKLNDDFSVDRNLERNLEEIMAANFEPIQISSIKLFESIPSEGFHQHNTLAEVKIS